MSLDNFSKVSIVVTFILIASYVIAQDNNIVHYSDNGEPKLTEIKFYEYSGSMNSEKDTKVLSIEKIITKNKNNLSSKETFQSLRVDLFVQKHRYPIYRSGFLAFGFFNSSTITTKQQHSNSIVILQESNLIRSYVSYVNVTISSFLELDLRPILKVRAETKDSIVGIRFFSHDNPEFLDHGDYYSTSAKKEYMLEAGNYNETKSIAIICKWLPSTPTYTTVMFSIEIKDVFANFFLVKECMPTIRDDLKISLIGFKDRAMNNQVAEYYLLGRKNEENILSGLQAYSDGNEIIDNSQIIVNEMFFKIMVQIEEEKGNEILLTPRILIDSNYSTISSLNPKKPELSIGAFKKSELIILENSKQLFEESGVFICNPSAIQNQEKFPVAFLIKMLPERILRIEFTKQCGAFTDNENQINLIHRLTVTNEKGDYIVKDGMIDNNFMKIKKNEDAVKLFISANLNENKESILYSKPRINATKNMLNAEILGLDPSIHYISSESRSFMIIFSCKEKGEDEIVITLSLYNEEELVFKLYKTCGEIEPILLQQPEIVTIVQHIMVGVLGVCFILCLVKNSSEIFEEKKKNIQARQTQYTEIIVGETK